MNRITLQIIDIDYVKKNIDSIKSNISKERLSKAEKLVNENDKLLSLGAAYLIFKHFPNREILYKEGGKPYLKDGPYFNISHSNEYIVIAISDNHKVGVDIEKIDEKRIPAIKHVLKGEGNTDDVDALFQMWSAKESLIKCISTGISDIYNVKALPLNGVKQFKEKKYYTYTTIYDGYSLSITTEGEEKLSLRWIK